MILKIYKIEQCYLWEKFSPRSAQVSGLPHGNSVSDRTFSDAMEGSKYFDEEIKFHLKI